MLTKVIFVKQEKCDDKLQNVAYDGGETTEEEEEELGASCGLLDLDVGPVKDSYSTMSIAGKTNLIND